MKISTKGRYGLRALVDLAAQTEGEPIPLIHIANRQNISLNYLEQVFGSLRKANIVKSVKGANGGYFLSRGAESITVKEILEVLEGVFTITDGESKDSGDYIKMAIQKLVWDRIDKEVNQFLEGTTLQQLVAEYNHLRNIEDIMYFI